MGNNMNGSSPSKALYNSTLPKSQRWRCPDTGEDLTEESGFLVSAGGRRYPIRDGIPRFTDSDAYAENFGIQWNLFQKTQLDSYTGVPLSRDRLRHCLGDALFASLRGKRVLEAGCGAGRFTEILLDEGAQVTSIDLSNAVDANARNFPIGEDHVVAQADILKLPFEARQFDVVICLGVLQHTPSTETSIEKLYEQVKPGGWLVVDHYTHQRRWSSLKPVYRQWLKRQPQNQVMPIIERMVDRYLPMHRALREFYPGWFLLCRVSPITTFYRSLPQLSDQLQREFSLLDTHDSLTDWFKHIRNSDEIYAALKALGAEQVKSAYAGNGVEGRCRRPE